MSKKWSSFGEQQLLTENWRKFLTEGEAQAEEIEEGFLGRIGTAAKAGAKAARKSWDETRPKPMVDYPATEMTTIVNLISSVAKKNKIQVDTSAIIDELEAMLKAQNFVIKEQGELMLGQELNLVLDQVPALRAFLEQIPADDAKLIMQAFQRGGFKSGAAPAAQPAAAQQKQAQDDTPSAEPEPQAQTITPEQRDQMVNSLINAEDHKTFVNLYNALDKSSFGGEDGHSISELLKSINKLSNNIKGKDYDYIENNEEKIVNFVNKKISNKIKSFGSDKNLRQQIKSKFMQLFVQPLIVDDDETPPEQQARAEKERDQMVDKMIAVDNYGDFVDLYGALGRSSFGKDKVSIDDLIQSVADVSDFKKEKNKKFTDEVIQTQINNSVLRYVSSFGSDKGQQIKDKFMELIIKPILGDDEKPPQQQPDEVPDDSGSLEDTPDSSEPDTQDQEIPDSPKPDDQAQDTPKEEFTPAQKRVMDLLDPNYRGEDFKGDFKKFIKAFKGLLKETDRPTVAKGLGIPRTKYEKIAREHSEIANAIGRLRLKDEALDSFLKDLKQAIKGTPKPAPAPEPSPEEEKEETVKIPEDFPRDLASVLDSVGIEDKRSEQANKLRRFYNEGLGSARMSLKRDNVEGVVKLVPDGSFKTGDPKKDAIGDPTRFRRDAQEHINKLYSEITKEPKVRSMIPNTINATKAYIAGVLKSFEIKGMYEEQETLNESTMLRWKELAGIL